MNTSEVGTPESSGNSIWRWTQREKSITSHEIFAVHDLYLSSQRNSPAIFSLLISERQWLTLCILWRYALWHFSVLLYRSSQGHHSLPVGSFWIFTGHTPGNWINSTISYGRNWEIQKRGNLLKPMQCGRGESPESRWVFWYHIRRCGWAWFLGIPWFGSIVQPCCATLLSGNTVAFRRLFRLLDLK
jgi:hypothetical protein